MWWYVMQLFTKTTHICSHRTFPWWCRATWAQCAQAWSTKRPPPLQISADCQDSGQRQVSSQSPSRSWSIQCCRPCPWSRMCSTEHTPMECCPLTRCVSPRKDNTPVIWYHMTSYYITWHQKTWWRSNMVHPITRVPISVKFVHRKMKDAWLANLWRHMVSCDVTWCHK